MRKPRYGNIRHTECTCNPTSSLKPVKIILRCVSTTPRQILDILPNYETTTQQHHNACGTGKRQALPTSCWYLCVRHSRSYACSVFDKASSGEWADSFPGHKSRDYTARVRPMCGTPRYYCETLTLHVKGNGPRAARLCTFHCNSGRKDGFDDSISRMHPGAFRRASDCY